MKVRHGSAGILAACALALSACGEQGVESQALTPPPVAPVEVTNSEDEDEDDDAPEADAESEELAQLRARVAELEEQLTTCRSAAPVEAAVPAVDAPAATEPATTTAEAAPVDAGVPRRRGQRERNVLGQVLDENGRPRGNDRTIEIPNPARILLGP